MRLFRILNDRLKGTRNHDRVAGEICEELRHHEDLLTERLIQEGRRPADARNEARRRVGNRARLQDSGYDVRGGGRLEAFVQDLRYGARRLRAAPAFGLIAIVTLALGIGANTAIFSVAAGLMIRSLVRMQQLDLGLRTNHVLTARVSLSAERYRQDGAASEFARRLVERVAMLPGAESAATIGTVFISATPNSTNFSIEGRPDFKPEERVEVPVDSITPDYFRVLRIPLREGRVYRRRDVNEHRSTDPDGRARRFDRPAIRALRVDPVTALRAE